MDCLTAADAETARALIDEPTTGRLDLILLDVMMPGQWGWEFLDDLRRRGNDTPVIFVTARHAVDERVKGLRLGADDYIAKPFAFDELMARVEAVVRRHRPNTMEVGDLSIDFERRSVQRGPTRIELSPREFSLLQTLAEAKGRTLSKDSLLQTVWGIHFDPQTNVVEVLVARLRRRVDPERQGLIETRSGEGYRLAVPEAKP